MKDIISDLAVVLGVPFFLVFYFFALLAFIKWSFGLFSL